MSLTQVLISAIAGAGVSLIATVICGRLAGGSPVDRRDVMLIAVVAGLSILLWREAGNTPTLNDDPIPLVSPNDVLCPVVTYICLNLLAGFQRTLQRPDWPRLCAVLTLMSFMVNVATI